MITPHWTVKVKTIFEDPETEKVKTKKESFKLYYNSRKKKRS